VLPVKSCAHMRRVLFPFTTCVMHKKKNFAHAVFRPHAMHGLKKLIAHVHMYCTISLRTCCPYDQCCGSSLRWCGPGSLFAPWCGFTIKLFTSIWKRIRIRLLTLMQIRFLLLIKVMWICVHWSTDLGLGISDKKIIPRKTE